MRSLQQSINEAKDNAQSKKLIAFMDKWMKANIDRGEVNYGVDSVGGISVQNSESGAVGSFVKPEKVWSDFSSQIVKELAKAKLGDYEVRSKDKKGFKVGIKH